MLKGFIAGLFVAALVFGVYRTQVIVIEESGFVYGLRTVPSFSEFLLEIKKEKGKLLDVLNVLTEGDSDQFQTDLIFATMVPERIDYIIFSTVEGNDAFMRPINPKTSKAQMKPYGVKAGQNDFILQRSQFKTD